MAKVKEHVVGNGALAYSFYCHGCNHSHVYSVKNSNGGPTWQFNDDVDKPTFTPSLLNTWGKHADPNWEEPTDKYTGLPFSLPKQGWSGICHLYVKEGMIEYLPDCTHHLAGQTVPMEDIQ